MSFKIYVDILFILAKYFLNQKDVLFNKELCEKFNNVNNKVCDGVL